MRASEFGGQFAHRIHRLVAITAGNEDGFAKEVIFLRGICDDLCFLDQVPQQHPREGAAIRPLAGEKEILDRGERLLTERREIKVLGKLHAASEAKEGAYPPSQVTGGASSSAAWVPSCAWTAWPDITIRLHSATIKSRTYIIRHSSCVAEREQGC